MADTTKSPCRGQQKPAGALCLAYLLHDLGSGGLSGEPPPHRCPLPSCSRVVPSHTFTVPSALAVAMRFPSGENATLVTPPLCSLRVSVSCPVCRSHTFTVLSWLPETIRVPSG